MIPALKNRLFNVKADKDVPPEEAYKINKKERFERAWQHVDGKIFEVIAKGWGKYHHYELLRMAIDGELNIVPQRVVDRIVDFMRRHESREWYEILFQEFDPFERDPLRLQLEEGWETVKYDEEMKEQTKENEEVTNEEIKEEQEEQKAKLWETIFVSVEPGSDEKAVYEDLLEKVSEENPHKKQFLHELSEGRTQKQIAEDLRILSPNTLTNWKNKFKERWKQLTES